MEIMAGRGISARAPTTLPADALRYMTVYKRRGFAGSSVCLGAVRGECFIQSARQFQRLSRRVSSVRGGTKGVELGLDREVGDQREIFGQPANQICRGLGADQGGGSTSPVHPSRKFSSTQVQPVLRSSIGVLQCESESEGNGWFWLFSGCRNVIACAVAGFQPPIRAGLCGQKVAVVLLPRKGFSIGQIHSSFLTPIEPRIGVWDSVIISISQLPPVSQ